MTRISSRYPFASLAEAERYRDEYVLVRYHPCGYDTHTWIEHVDNDGPGVILHVSRWSSCD